MLLLSLANLMPVPRTWAEILENATGLAKWTQIHTESSSSPGWGRERDSCLTRTSPVLLQNVPVATAAGLGSHLLVTSLGLSRG